MILGLGFPTTCQAIKFAINFWERVLFKITLPNKEILHIGKNFSVDGRGWYYKYIFPDGRWTGPGDFYTFEELYDKVKFITDDLHNGGKVSWGFWNHA